MTYKTRIVRTTDEFTALEGRWGDLLSRSPANNYFLSWEWLWNWWHVFARPDDRLTILLIEKGDDLIGVAPFFVRKRLLGGIYPVRRMMFLGTQEEGGVDVGSDYMDLICREGEEKRAVAVFFKIIAEQDICDELYLSKIDTATESFALFQEAARKLKYLTLIAETSVSPYIELPSTWDEYLNSLAPSMRYKIRNGRRRLQKSGGAVVHKVKNAVELARGFEELARLHKKRWESRGMAGAFAHEQFVRFHKRIMPSMLQQGRLGLYVLTEDNDSKAVIYNIVYKNKVYFYQSGVDTADRKSAFGYVLHSHCIEEAIEQGMAEYDFLPKGARDDYKDRFSTQRRTVSDIYVASQWGVKHFVRAKELARRVYHRSKPRLQSRDKRI